jgi:hypothetical protein
MRGYDGKAFLNASATTPTFPLVGGLYGMDVVATGSGSVTLQKLGGDGATWVTAATAFATTGAYATAYLAPGTYRFAIATFTAVYIQIVRVPGD